MFASNRLNLLRRWVLVILGVVCTNAFAGRLALVIGNARYAGQPLSNPANDAIDMSRELARLGFDVHVHQDLGRHAMREAVTRFATAAAGAELAVVYFAGHGVQVAGENFLLPVDASVTDERDVVDQAVGLQQLLAALSATKVHRTVVVLDACRDNPLTPAGGGFKAGLVRPELAFNATIVAFAAADGQTAEDGPGRNGTYTGELLQQLRRDQDVRDIFDETALAVARRVTKQRPKVYGDTGAFKGYFLTGAAQGVTAQPSRDATLETPDDAAWRMAQIADTGQAYASFIAEFPNSRFVPAARIARDALAAGARRPPTSAAAPRIVLIGHAGPMSGTFAHFGRDTANGVRMAIEDLNAAAITIRGEPIQFQLLALDDASDPQTAVMAANRFCASGVVAVVGHLHTGTTLPASAVYERCGIPVVTGSATGLAITRSGRSTAFRVIADDDAVVTAVGIYAADTLKVRRVALVDDRTAYGRATSDAFKRVMGTRGITVVDHYHTTPQSSSFVSILEAAKREAVDAIFLGASDRQAGGMLQEMQQLGLAGVKLLGGDALCTTQLPRLAAGVDALLDVSCAEPGADVAATRSGAVWKERYVEKYPGHFQAFSPYTYDATHILVEAMRRADSTDPRVYLSALRATAWQGVSGFIQFDADGNLRDPGVALYQYRRGQRAIVGAP